MSSPTAPPRSRPFVLLGTVLAALALVLAGCGGAAKATHESPAKRLTAAKAKLDKTPGLKISLKADKLPASVSGVLSAEGTGTHQPGFTGTIRVFQNGLALSVPLVAIDGKVYVKFGTWQTIDPAAYNAPDPAALMSPDSGLSTLLVKATKLKVGSQKRDGDLRVTTITGSVPGAVVAKIIPTAAPGKTFDAAFTLTDNQQLTKAVLTGPFYAKGGDVTYTFTFSDYGSGTSVKAP